MASHVQVLGDDNLSPSSSLSLPHFLNLLKDRGVINSCHDDIVTEAIESYNNARFNPGVSYIYIYACMYVCMYICMYVYMYVVCM